MTNPTPKRSGRFRMGPLDIPLPPWSVACIALLVVVGATAFLIGSIVVPNLGSEIIPTSQLKELQEAQKHLNETDAEEAVLFDDARGRIRAQYFKSDKCILLTRQGENDQLEQSVWVFNPDLAGSPPELEASLPEDRSDLKLAGLAPVTSSPGRCLQPHPGNFASRYGARNDCWVQVWRRWPDGCEHWQWFNSCYNTWNQQINWVRCVH